MTLFLNQSLQNFEVFLAMISGTSVQNFSRKKRFYITMATHSIKSTFVFSFVIPRSISAQNLSKIGQETKKLQKWEIIVTSSLKIAQQFLCLNSFSYTY